jgi:hypothetical protein
MSNTDFDPQQQAPPQQPYYPPPPPSPLTQAVQQQQQPTRIASAETPGVNFTGGRMDAVPRDAQTNLPTQQGPLPRPFPPRQPIPQRFVPNATRGPSEWGKPHGPIVAAQNNPDIYNTSQMPTPEEGPGVMQGAGRQLADWGAPSVAGPARIASGIASFFGPVLDFYSHNAFSTHYRNQMLGGLREQQLEMQGRREAMELDRERRIDAAYATYNANHQHTLKYKQIYDNWKSHVYGDNPGKNEEGARRAIENIANAEPGGPDTTLIQALHNGGIDAAINLIDSRDAKALDLLSGAMAVERGKTRSGKTVKEESDFDKLLGPESEGGTDRFPYPGQTAAAGTAPEAKPTTPEETRADLKRKYPKLGDAGIDAAYSISETGKYEGETATSLTARAKERGSTVLAAAKDLDNRLDNAARSGGDPDENIESMKQINPNAATQTEGLIKYQLDPSRASQKDLNRAMSASNGKYNQAFYKTAQALQNPETIAGRENTRVLMLGGQSLPIFAALKELQRTLPEGTPIPMRAMLAKLSTNWDGDPRFTNLFHAIQGFGVDVGGVASGTGTARVAIFNRLVQHMGETASPQQIRGAMIAEMQSGMTIINTSNEYWRQQTGLTTPAPMFAGRGADNYYSIMHMNTKTGEMPEGSNPEIMSVSIKGPAGSAPMSTPNRKGLMRWIEKNRDDPAKADQVNQAIELLGFNP